jgi:hypothetical protein
MIEGIDINHFWLHQTISFWCRKLYATDGGKCSHFILNY